MDQTTHDDTDRNNNGRLHLLNTNVENGRTHSVKNTIVHNKTNVFQNLSKLFMRKLFILTYILFIMELRKNLDDNCRKINQVLYIRNNRNAILFSGSDYARKVYTMIR